MFILYSNVQLFKIINIPLDVKYCRFCITYLIQKYHRKYLVLVTRRYQVGFFKLLLTSVHPCSCKSQSLPAPDTHLTNIDSRTQCHTCMTRWVGRGGVGIRCFSNIHLRFTRPSVYKKSRQYVFKKNMVMFTPNSDQFRGI